MLSSNGTRAVRKLESKHMSLYHEWEANLRYQQVLREVAQGQRWNLEDRRMPRAESSLWRKFARLFAPGTAAVHAARAHVARANVATENLTKRQAS